MLCIGYGTVEPIRKVEVLVTLLSMALGATLYGLFIASLTSFLADSEASARIYSSQLDMLKQYMKHRQLPAALRVKLRTYLELCFPNKRAFDEGAILNSLNIPLRREVAYEKCKYMIERLPLFESHMLKEGLMGALALALERQVFVAEDYILREGEYGHDMYFIASGEVAVVTGPPGQHVEVTRLREGAFFGEMALLDESERHMASVLVVNFCEALWMSRDRYRKLVRDYPSIRDYLESIARLRLATSLEKSADCRASRTELRGADLSTLLDERKKQRKSMAGRASMANGHNAAPCTAGAGASMANRRKSVMNRVTRRSKEKEEPKEGGGGGFAGVNVPSGSCNGRRNSIDRATVSQLRHEQRNQAGWTAADGWSRNDARSALHASAAAASVLYSDANSRRQAAIARQVESAVPSSNS